MAFIGELGARLGINHQSKVEPIVSTEPYRVERGQDGGLDFLAVTPIRPKRDRHYPLRTNDFSFGTIGIKTEADPEALGEDEFTAMLHTNVEGVVYAWREVDSSGRSQVVVYDPCSVDRKGNPRMVDSNSFTVSNRTIQYHDGNEYPDDSPISVTLYQKRARIDGKRIETDLISYSEDGRQTSHHALRSPIYVVKKPENPNDLKDPWTRTTRNAMVGAAYNYLYNDTQSIRES